MTQTPMPARSNAPSTLRIVSKGDPAEAVRNTVVMPERLRRMMTYVVLQ